MRCYLFDAQPEHPEQEPEQPPAQPAHAAGLPFLGRIFLRHSAIMPNTATMHTMVIQFAASQANIEITIL